MRNLLAGLAVVAAGLAATPVLAQKPKSSAFEEPTAAERARLRELLDVVRRADRVEALPIEVTERKAWRRAAQKALPAGDFQSLP
jgi:hypothetical protein